MTDAGGETEANELSATLAALLGAAEATKLEETAVRRQAAARIAELEKVRVHAYRRHRFVHMLGSAAAVATDHESSLSAQATALASRLDWEPGRTPEQQDMVDALKPVMERIADACGFGLASGIQAAEPVAEHSVTTPEPLVAALSIFERWFAERFDCEVWQLFDRFTPDSPAVDF